jgi:hypothetical protein
MDYGACGAQAASMRFVASLRGGRLDMSNPQDRQAGASGSTMGGYEPGQVPAGQAQAGSPETEGRPGGRETYGREYTGARHTGEHRGAVVTFTAVAGTLMILSGLLSIVVGIVALSNTHFYVASPSAGYTFRWSLHGWGWAELIIGIVIFAAGVSVFLGMAWARYLGAALAVISAVGHFMFLPFTPLWSIVVIVIDAFIIWALLTPRREPGQF